MTSTDIERAGDNALEGFTIDPEAVLKSLNLNPRDPNAQALVLICQRYELDPFLRHVVLIKGNVYVTRDGYLAAAHRSGQFDGMEVVDQGADDTHHWAKVAVYRKDMGRPFTYTGRYPRNGGNKEFGPEMAVKCAEVAALRRAFGVTGAGAAEERWDVPETDVQVAQAVAGALPPGNVDGETGEVGEVGEAPASRRRPPPSSGGGDAAGGPSSDAPPASDPPKGNGRTAGFPKAIANALTKAGFDPDSPEAVALLRQVADVGSVDELAGETGKGNAMMAAVKSVKAGEWTLAYDADGTPRWDTGEGEAVQGELVKDSGS